MPRVLKPLVLSDEDLDTLAEITTDDVLRTHQLIVDTVRRPYRNLVVAGPENGERDVDSDS